MDIDLPADGSIDTWLDRAALYLAATSNSSRLDAQLLLAHLLQQSATHLITHANERPGTPKARDYQRLIARRALGEPLAYIIGRREFWSLDLAVTPDVLVPRPETELVVERALALRANDPHTVLDLGTGSGAIALALAYERPQWRLVASDVSAAALAVAAANARRLGLTQIEFVHSNWFDGLAGRQFALIAANPPYIRAADPALADPGLRHEPALALSPGSTGLEALLQIASQAQQHLQPGGALVLEHGADQADDLARALVAQGYARVRCHNDLAGLDRVTEALRP